MQLGRRTVEINRHLSQSELAQLLDMERDEFDLTLTNAHLENCERCQLGLETLAAQPEQWKKALQFLKDADFVESSPATLPSDTPYASEEKSGEQSPMHHSAEDILSPPSHPEMLGRLGGYDIECEVGRGGMGVVFKAFDRKLHRVVALKVLAHHLAENGTARKRFAQEAIAAAGVIHPNVIAVHSVNDQEAVPFITMTYVDGISLQSLVSDRGPLAEIDIVRIALQISAGLSAAHSQGLVHRDIKPANILVETSVNRVVITDFGLARAVDDASLTQTGWLTGTPNYMSPEQTRGQRPDQRSDLFSLGSTLYFLATGRLPFRSETALGVLDRIQNDAPTPLRKICPHVSSSTTCLIDRLLAKQPDNRLQSADELHLVLEKLLEYLRQPDVSAPPRIMSVSRTAGWHRTRKLMRRAVIVGVWLFAAGTLGGIVFVWSGGISLRQPLLSWSSSRFGISSSNDFDKLDYSTRETDAELLIDNATNFLLLERYDEAIALFSEAARSEDHAAQANYNLGCAWALKGEPTLALTALTQAIDEGFKQEKLFRTDDDLNSLRDDPRFHALLQRLK